MIYPRQNIVWQWFWRLWIVGCCWCLRRWNQFYSHGNTFPPETLCNSWETINDHFTVWIPLRPSIRYTLTRSSRPLATSRAWPWPPPSQTIGHFLWVGPRCRWGDARTQSPQPLAHIDVACPVVARRLVEALVNLEIADFLVELFPLEHVRHGIVKNTLGKSNHLCCNANSSLVQDFNRVLVTFAHLTQHIGSRDLCHQTPTQWHRQKEMETFMLSKDKEHVEDARMPS